MKTFIQFAQRARTQVSVCVTIMCVTVGLGVLQFNWLSELSERERESRQSHLTADVLQFGQDFDRELTRTYSAFQLDGEALDRRDAGDVSMRYDSWMEQAAYPHLVRDIWIAEPADAGADPERVTSWRFLHFDIQRRRLTEGERPQAWHEPTQHTTAAGPLDEDTLSIQIPIFSVAPAARPHSIFPSDGQPIAIGAITTRFVILQLDRHCIMNEVLPALTRRYLAGSTPPGEPEYQVVIVRNRIPHEVIYAANLRDNGTLPASVDATAPLLGIRSLVIAGGLKTEARLTQASYRPVTTAPPTLTAVAAVPFGAPPKEYWELRVTHRAGSLEAFASQARTRNLLISATILVVLAGSLALLLVAARRTHSLGRQQMEFVAGISHELRTPISVIGVIGANLAEDVVSDREQIRKYGVLIQREGRRLTEMIEQVLSYARIQSSNLPPREPFAIDELVLDAVDSLQPQMSSLGFTCILGLEESLPSVLVEPASMVRVIQNLITNALKYSGEHREIHVATGKEVSRGAVRVWVAVTDQGIGIPPEEQALIFEPFRRGRTAVEHSLPGTGLGLALVSSIVQAHGGTVDVRSELGQGSTFTVYLPATGA